jgi:carboxyl-terminal processing protease
MNRIAFTALAGLLLAAVVWAALGGGEAKAQEHHSFRQYTELLEKVQAWYPGEAKGDRLVYASIEGMLDMLDPHSNFLDPDAYHSMQQRQVGRFSGLGIIVGIRDDHVTVISPIEGTPAHRLGIRAGDIITEIDGVSTEGKDIDEVVDKLRGPQGSQVAIAILRRGLAAPLKFTIIREMIPETSVRYAFMLDDRTGYVRITDFNRTTAQELEDALKGLEARGMQRLLLDLRDNPGGVLEQSVEVCDLFLKGGSMVVFTRGRDASSFQEYRTPSRRPRRDLPVVVMVSAGSASASEIVAGALQDHDRATIVGETTFGKGLVQSVYELGNSSALALTTARYYTPSGRCIQRDYTNLADYYRGANGKPSEGEAFKTDRGRTVHGGGGITPDVVIKAPEVPLRQFQLQLAGGYFNFAVDFSNRHPDLPRDFEPDAKTVDEFAAHLVKAELLTAEQAKEMKGNAAEMRILRTLLRREVLSARFGMTQGYRSTLKDDDQVTQALAQFGPAAELARLYFQ